MHWTESQSETSTENEETRVREDIHYSNREDYFKHKIHLFGSGIFLVFIQYTLVSLL